VTKSLSEKRRHELETMQIHILEEPSQVPPLIVSTSGTSNLAARILTLDVGQLLSDTVAEGSDSALADVGPNIESRRASSPRWSQLRGWHPPRRPGGEKDSLRRQVDVAKPYAAAISGTDECCGRLDAGAADRHAAPAPRQPSGRRLVSAIDTSLLHDVSVPRERAILAGVDAVLCVRKGESHGTDCLGCAW